jgi:hypothetical protein
MNWMDSDKEPRIFLIGVLTNQSPLAWHHLEFECRFFNAQGQLIDAHVGEGYSTVQPHDDLAFRISFAPSRPRSDYATHKLTVSNARNTKRIY